MLIIIDKRIPEEAKRELKQVGILAEVESTNRVYPSISGHPDIFIFQHQHHLIISPQLNKEVIEALDNNSINYSVGESIVGKKYPSTTAYNISANAGLFIGCAKYADPKIIREAQGKKWIESPQAYARCNSLILNQDYIITSEITVHKSHYNSLYINTEEIVLPGHKYGFIGGCMGINNRCLYVLGNLDRHSQGNEIRSYCKKSGYTIKELYNGPLLDAGGIFFVE